MEVLGKMKITTTHTTLLDAAIPGTGLLRDIVLVGSFTLLTAVFARFSIWIGPVPVSGQTFAVLLAGALLGSRRGALSQLSYLAVGLTGIPYWFALGGAPGIARLVGPTGGYLLGFAAAAFIVGWLTERGWDKHSWTAAVAMIAGSVVMYIAGLSWLAHYVQPDRLLQAGLYPFIAGDLIKIALASVLLPSGWLLLRRFGS